MRRHIRTLRFFSIADAFVLFLLAGLLAAVMLMAQRWNGDFAPAVEIDLSLKSLPLYTLFSASRGIASYFISLAFSLVYGYAAARIPRAERFMIPVLDILQCVPVLGFLPGLVLGLISVFPNSNIGLELATILMIFTSQAWNMAFSFYASLRSVPQDLKEVTQIAGLSWWQRFTSLELPISAVGLAWNSLMSMAGGWFFLTICESFTLGDRVFRLPGLGSYMSVAIEQGNRQAMFFGIVAMMTLIVGMDLLIWRPLLVWVRRYTFDAATDSVEAGHSFLLTLFQESRLLSGIQGLFKRRRRHRRSVTADVPAPSLRESDPPSVIKRKKHFLRMARWVALVCGSAVAAVIMGSLAMGIWRLGGILKGLGWPFWVILFRDAFWTMLRVFAATALSTLWAVPVGLFIGLSPRLLRIAQPIVQVIAAFPAPMLYPLVLALLLRCGVDLDYGSVFLMIMGVQWYVLFNVIAGAMGISKDLQASLRLAGVSKRTMWTKLYIPGIFPSLVVGWITAAGGTWNASIVTEYFKYNHTIHKANGLGSAISRAAETGNFAALAASIIVLIVLVVALNRLIWHPLSELAERRFRMDR